MDSKRPYTHILKNLFHEQAAEIVPLLLPDFRVKLAFDFELARLESTLIEGPPEKKELVTQVEQGLANLVLPGAEVVGVYQTEWIEHSGNFERAYVVDNKERMTRPTYLLVEVQTEREDTDLPMRFLCTYVRLHRYVGEDILGADSIDDEDDSGDDEQDSIDDEQDTSVDEEDSVDDEEERGTLMNKGYDIYPYVLCPFPQAVPPHIEHDRTKPSGFSFRFLTIFLWETDARECLNTHVSAIYYLLPAMKNVDAALLGLAIGELAQRFQSDEQELGRHLTGLHLMLQESEMMSEEEKLAAREHLKPFAHLIKNDPEEGQ